MTAILRSFFVVVILSASFSLSGCFLLGSKDDTSTRIITSPLDTSRAFARSVSVLKGFDRVATINLATSFSWWDSTGSVRQMGDSYGTVMAIYFWNPSQSWSLKTSTELVKAKTALRDSQVVYLGIPMGVGRDSAAVWVTQRIADSLGMSFQQIIGNSEFGYAYGGINAVPTLFIVARTGKVYQTLEGAQSAEQIESAIRKTLSYVPIR